MKNNRLTTKNIFLGFNYQKKVKEHFYTNVDLGEKSQYDKSVIKYYFFGILYRTTTIKRDENI